MILAGGLGTRLRPLVADRPKCLAPVGDSVFLEIILRLLKQQGLRRFILCVGYKSEMVQSYFGNGEHLGVDIAYSDEGEHLLGTAGAIRKALSLIDERAIVINGDTYFAIAYDDLLVCHQSNVKDSGLQLTVALSQKDDCSQCGSVTLNTARNRITGFYEKGTQPGSRIGWVNAGAYLMERLLIEKIPQDISSSLEKDIIPAEINAGRYPVAYLSNAPFFDIGTPASLELFRRHLSETE